ncbi:glycosyltransferase [Streptomyces sp. NPDC094048]
MNRPETSTVPPHFPVFHVVLLTMNDRPDQERAAQATLLAQKGVELRICVVGNGCVPDIVPAGACTVVLKENVGIPGGRNAGARALAESGRPGDYLFFLDNDATFPADDVLARLVAEADQHPDAAYVQPRLTGPDDATTPRRWVPRLRAGSAARPGVITTMTEGVILVRRNIFDALGGWEARRHEGLDLAYRCWSAGYTGWYAAEIRMHHPVTSPARHRLFYQLAARNRASVRLPQPSRTADPAVPDRLDRHHAGARPPRLRSTRVLRWHAGGLGPPHRAAAPAHELAHRVAADRRRPSTCHLSPGATLPTMRKVPRDGIHSPT